MIRERIADLIVQERQQAIPVVDQVYLHAKPREDRSVLTTDNARAENYQRTRRVGQAQDGIGAVDTRMAEVDICWAIGARAGGNDNFLGHQLFHAFLTITHHNSVLVFEAGDAVEQVNAVARIKSGAHFNLLINRTAGAFHHFWEGEPAGLTDIAEHSVGIERHDLLDLMAQRFGRNSAPVGAVTAYLSLLLNYRHPHTVLSSINSSAFSGGAGTDHHDIVIVNRHTVWISLFPDIINSLAHT